jgi:predicted lipoprotein with Yx(FWY)xxD motif
MTNRLRGVAAVGACALALALTACGGGGNSAAPAANGQNGQDMSQMSPQDMANMPGMNGNSSGGNTSGGNNSGDMSQMNGMGGMGATTDGSGGMSMGGNPGQTELWAVQSGPLGVVTTDGGGRIVYQFDKDSTSPPASACVDSCLQNWEPVMANDQPVSGLGVDESKIGTVVRPDGSKQVTLYNHPIYLHKGENGGLANAGANGADGVWWAINPYGAKADPLPAVK